MAEVDGVELTAKQAKRHAGIVRTFLDQGLDEEAAESEAAEVWRTLYSLTGSKWKTKTVAKTSRGFSFAQRPEEAAELPTALLDSDAYPGLISEFRSLGAVLVSPSYAVVVSDGTPLIAEWGSRDGRLVLDPPVEGSEAEALAALEAVRRSLASMSGVELARAALAIDAARRLGAFE